MNESFASYSRLSHNRSRSFGNNTIKGMAIINEEASLYVNPKEYSSPPIKKRERDVRVINESLVKKL